MLCKLNMRRSSTDLLVFVLMAALLLDLDFNNMSALNWISCVVALLWFVLFVVKLFVAKRGA